MKIVGKSNVHWEGVEFYQLEWIIALCYKECLFFYTSINTIT